MVHFVVAYFGFSISGCFSMSAILKLIVCINYNGTHQGKVDGGGSDMKQVVETEINLTAITDVCFSGLSSLSETDVHLLFIWPPEDSDLAL